MDSTQFPHYAQIHIDTTKQIFGVDLTFDEKSISTLDELIGQAWPEQPPAQIDNVILLFGSFLGETMVKNLGGAWVETEQGWGVKIGDATANVFTKVRKRLLNGMEDSLAYYYHMIQTMAPNNFSEIVT